jgi:hypothetical protein
VPAVGGSLQFVCAVATQNKAAIIKGQISSIAIVLRWKLLCWCVLRMNEIANLRRVFRLRSCADYKRVAFEFVISTRIVIQVPA